MKDAVYKLPQKFLERLKEIYPASYPMICETFLRDKEATFRINYLKIDLARLREALSSEGIRYRELSFPRGSFILKESLREFQKSYIYRDGLVYVQNVASMLPAIVLNPSRGERILDLCAAPGAKTTQIASLAGPDIELVAIEKIAPRYYKLLANLKLQGADFVKAHLADGIAAKNRYQGYFDKVLLDAQCSCEGRFFVPEPRTYKYWSERKIKEMAHKQKRLLYSAVSCLKEGGELVYSTCTFAPEENEAALDWALNKFAWLKVVPVVLPMKNVKAGLTSWRGRQFSPALRYALRIIPDDIMEGFFIAKFKSHS